MNPEKLRQEWIPLIQKEAIPPLEKTYETLGLPPHLQNTLLPLTLLEKTGEATRLEFELEENVERTLKKKELLEKQSSVFSPQEKVAPEASYEIVKFLASGGMGSVFKGYQVTLERSVAIKTLLPQFQASLADQEKFIAESKVTAFLDHPNIVPVYDLGKGISSAPILVMKLIGGTSWKHALEAHPPLQGQIREDLEKHLEILCQVCYAVAFAHSKKIIHNDLKPDNIMLGEFGEVYVMDWGIALYCGEPPAPISALLHHTMVHTPMGTPFYMAPELASGKGKQIGPWTDVYLLGGILYEILTGKPLHWGKSLYQVLVYLSEPQDLCFPESSIPQELQEICRKALASAPQERYQSVSEFHQALRSFLQHQESILLTEKSTQLRNKASKHLTQLQHEEATPHSQQQEQEEERNQLYEQFAQGISGFQQALYLWEENEIARLAQIQARYTYAQAALFFHDFGLARSQQKQLAPQSPEFQQLETEIAQLQEQHLRHFITHRLSSLCLFILIILLGVKLPLSLLFHWQGDQQFLILQNNPFQFFLNSLFIAVSFLVYRLSVQKKYPATVFLKIAWYYQMLGVFLASLMFFSLNIPPETKSIGIYPSAFWFVLFPLMLPFTKKMNLQSAFWGIFFILIALGISQILLQKPWIPTHLTVFYLVQHLLFALTGYVLTQRDTRSLLSKRSFSPSL